MDIDGGKGQKVADYVKKKLSNLSHNLNSAKREEKLLFRTN